MEVFMLSQLRYSRLALFAGLTCAATTAPLPSALAQGVVPCVHEARFGLIGLARLQVARLSVVNALPPDPVTPPDPVHPPNPIQPPDPCRIAIGFLNTSNQPFVNSAGEPLIVQADLAPGQSAFVDLSAADAFRASRELRMSFRATGLFSHEPLPEGSVAPEPCAAVLSTLEIFDVLTGRTQVVVNPPEIFGFNPQPEPPGVTSASH
jgi:hypothetical protein